MHNYGFSLSTAPSKDGIKMIRKLLGVLTHAVTWRQQRVHFCVMEKWCSFLFPIFTSLAKTCYIPIELLYVLWRRISQFSYEYSIQFSSHLTIKSLLFVTAITGASSSTVIWWLLRFSIIKISWLSCFSTRIAHFPGFIILKMTTDDWWVL